MSYELVREVRDFCPPGLTAAERLLLVWIAEQSREEDRYYRGELIEARTCFPGNEDLVRWMGFKDEPSLRAVFRRLAARGLEVRVPIGRTKKGGDLFAVPGRRMTLRLPELGRDPAQGVTTVTPRSDRGYDEESPRSPAGVTTVTPTREPLDSPREEHVVISDNDDTRPAYRAGVRLRSQHDTDQSYATGDRS